MVFLDLIPICKGTTDVFLGIIGMQGYSGLNDKKGSRVLFLSREKFSRNSRSWKKWIFCLISQKISNRAKVAVIFNNTKCSVVKQ